jgi:hypothetical protein
MVNRPILLISRCGTQIGLCWGLISSQNRPPFASKQSISSNIYPIIGQISWVGG